MRTPYAWFAFLLAVIAGAACDNMPGRAAAAMEVARPEQVQSFDVLYAENCAGCHGKDGQNGPATNLANPEYEALIDDATFRDITAKGQEGTLMPGFGHAAGGPLTDAQIDALVSGMRERWQRADVVRSPEAPPYASQSKPNLQYGKEVYTRACARCHGADAQTPGKAGSVLDGTFLGLVSDQVIRTTTIAGRPDLGMPDYRNDTPGSPLSDQEITDVVAWIGSHRPQSPGRPYPGQQVNSPPGSHDQNPEPKGQ